jgi:hypothetical protein
MESLILKPNETFNFSTFFENFKELSHKYPYRIKIMEQAGDLTLLSPAIEGKNQNSSIDIRFMEFDEIFASSTYGFKSIKGCHITYDIWQLGKIMTL